MRFLLFLGCAGLLSLSAPAATPTFARRQEEPSEMPAEALRHAAEIERAQALIQDGKTAEAVAILGPIAERELAELGAQSPYTVKAFNNLAYAQSADGQHAEARQTAYRALELAQAQGEPSVSTAMVKRSLAEIALALSETKEAQVWIEDACRDLEATYGRTPMAAETRELAARIALSLGELDPAQEHLERALAIHERYLGLANETTARPLGPLAQIAAQRGQPGTAILLRGTERAILEGSGAVHTPAWFESVQQELALLVELGEEAAAQRLAEKLVAQWILAEGSPADRFEALLAAGTTYWNVGAVTSAVPLLEQAQALLPELDTSTVAHDLRCLLPLVQSLLMAGDPEAALAQLEAYVPAETADYDPALSAELGLLRARTYSALGRREEARKILLEALHGLRALTGEASPALRELLLELMDCEDSLTGASALLVDLVEMIAEPLANLPPSSLARAQRTAWRRGQAAFTAPLVQAWMRLAHKTPAKLAQAADALEGMRAREELASLAWAIESAEALADVPLQSHLAALHAIEAGARRDDGLLLVRPALESKSSRYADLFAERTGSLAQARAWLKDDGHVLLQLLWSQRTAWAWLVHRDAAQDVLLPLGDVGVLEPLVAQARQSLSNFQGPPNLDELSRTLLQPLAAQLEGVARLTVIAEGPLAYVPYEALSFADGSFLAERLRVDYAISLHSLGSGVAATKAAQRMLHIGPVLAHEAVTLSYNVKALRERHGAAFSAIERPDLGVVWPEGDVQVAAEAACESGLAALGQSGAWKGVRAVEFQTEAIVDALVPSASGLLLSPEKNDDGRPGWRRPDGFLDLAEVAKLELDCDLVLLPRALCATGDSAAGLRSQALAAMVASWFRAGTRALALTTFVTADNRARLFDQALLAEVRAKDPQIALAATQGAWLQRARRTGDASLLHPGIWARWRLYGR